MGEMSLKLMKSTRRRCPKCNSMQFYMVEHTTIGETIEKCDDCGYIEASPAAICSRTKTYWPEGSIHEEGKWTGKYYYEPDPNGEWHYHGKYGWHKVSVEHRRVEGEIYAFEEL